VHFEYQTSEKDAKVVLAADYLRWDSERWVFEEIEPGHHVLNIPRPWTESLEYKLVVNGRWIRDPSNPKSVPDGYGGVNSLIDDIGFTEDPWLKPLNPGEPRWRAFQYRIEDYEGVPRMITVLHPPASLLATRAKTKGDPRTLTAYFQDGNDYLDLASARSFLSRLAQAHPELPLVTGVFVPPRDRLNEYGLTEKSRAYGQFLANKLVPQIEARFPTGGDSARRLLIGPSLGGLVTLETAVLHPETFGLAASQSGSIWFEEGKILELFKPGSGVNQKFFLEVGLFESERMIEMNRKARDRAKALGWNFTYREYPSTHTWSAWRNRLREIFITLLPKTSGTP
jgi:enterochelin esterase family protein